MVEDRMSTKELIGKKVYREIATLTGSMNKGYDKATFAHLRNGVRKAPGEDRNLWYMLFNELPEEFLNNDGKPTKAEWAIYISLTMFALHQQSNNENVHQSGINLGEAVFKLMNEKTDSEYKRVMRRFEPLTEANSIYDFSYALSSLIKMMKDKGIKLDYVMLAKDIYDFQFSEGKQDVVYRWGKGFHKKYNITKGE